MTEHEKELSELRARCSNLEKSYRESYPVTVENARNQGRTEMLREVVEYLRTTEDQRADSPTGMADELQNKFEVRG